MKNGLVRLLPRIRPRTKTIFSLIIAHWRDGGKEDLHLKATGIVRNIDELGRVVIPKELRRTLGWSNSDPIEVFVEGERVILQRYTLGCFFCGTTKEQVQDLLGKKACPTCIKKLNDKLAVAEASAEALAEGAV